MVAAEFLERLVGFDVAGPGAKPRDALELLGGIGASR